METFENRVKRQQSGQLREKGFHKLNNEKVEPLWFNSEIRERY